MTEFNAQEGAAGRLFRPTDVAVLNDVGSLRLLDGSAVPTIMSTPARAEADFMKVLCIGEREALPLPRIAVQRTGITHDQQRFCIGNYRRMRYTPDRNAVQVGRHPSPYNLDYQINFWDKYRGRLSYLVEHYLDRFDPNYRIVIDFGPTWGKFDCHSIITSVDDASELEPGEEGDRKLRMNVSITVESWMMKEARWFPTLLVGVTDYDNIAGINIETQTKDYGGNQL